MRSPQGLRRAPSPKRAVPDYDGRGRPEAQPDAAWWALRAPLAPAWLASELVLRRPLGHLTVMAERAEVPRSMYDFFFFGPDHKAGIVPVALAEFGFNASVGLYGLWDDAFFAKGSQLRVHFEGWPTEWLAGSIMERHRLDDHTTLRLRAKGVRRPDNVFYGIGPSSQQANQSRYASSSLDAEASIEARVWRSTGVEIGIGVRKMDTTTGKYGADPSVETAVAAGRFALPYGFGHGYVNPFARASARFDTRAPAAQTGSGLRLEAHLEKGGDVGRSSGFVRWGGTTTFILDVTGTGRILSASFATAFADPLGKDPVPFTELASLGGERFMAGFYRGRLVDRSSAVAAIDYRWPIAAGVNATLQSAAGNVFGEHLAGFHPKLLRLSFSAGVATTTDPPLELLFGFATDTFERGARVESARFSFGVPTRL